jgi:hypothetical protein
VNRVVPLVIFGVVLGCGRTPSAGGCPAAYRSDPSRAARIEALVDGDPEGALLLRAARGSYVVCFSPKGAGVTSGDTLLLDESADDPHLAARTAHLLLHRTRGELRTSGDPRDAVEARGSALEARVLARLVGE